jgi:protein involved in polysaccharide export with SLBB domain
MKALKIIAVSLMGTGLACSIQSRSLSGVPAEGGSKVLLSEESVKAEVRQANAGSRDVSSGEYRLGYGDVVEIKFFYHSEYNEQVTVRPDGKISLLLIGDLDVVGMAPSELEEIVIHSYNELLVNPQVTVIVREFGGQECYVMGEVFNPGRIAISKGMTLLRAIAAAGGPKRTGKLNSVILIRALDQESAEVTRINLGFASLQDRIQSDLSIQAYDVIYVPRTFIEDVRYFVTQIYDIVLPPFDTWSRYKYWYTRD